MFGNIDRHDILISGLDIALLVTVFTLAKFARRNPDRPWVIILFRLSAGPRTDVQNMTKAQLLESSLRFMTWGLIFLSAFPAWALLFQFNGWNMDSFGFVGPWILLTIFVGMGILGGAYLFLRYLFRSKSYVPPPPFLLNGARVLFYADTGGPNAYTGRITVNVRSPGGSFHELGAIPRMAFCQSLVTPEYFLMHCNDYWNVLGVIADSSIEEARNTAEMEFVGISSRWIPYRELTQAEMDEVDRVRSDLEEIDRLHPVSNESEQV